MSNTYKVNFRPLEPYFFGNEKSFHFPGETASSAYANSYFVRSEKMPSQSTILGALRYIFLPYKWEDMEFDTVNKIKKNRDAVGESSFDFKANEIQSFGCIKAISPVFISGTDTTLIATPMDHAMKTKNQETDEDEINTCYKPFTDYHSVNTAEGKKLYALDFDVKEGLAHSYVNIENGEIVTEDKIFRTDLRIGINRKKEKDGFFKKEYRMLEKDFAFSVYVTLDVQEDPVSKVVFLGQGKSPFAVTFEKSERGFTKEVEVFLGKYTRTDKGQFVYCLSDCFITDFDKFNSENKESDVLFCAIDTKDYRKFTTEGKGNFKKDDMLYRQLKAGSIVIVKSDSDWVTENANKNAENIGFNTFVTIGGAK